MRVRDKDLVQQVFSDRKGGRNVTKVQWPRVKATTRVGIVNELHVVLGYLLWGCGEVVEVHFGETP